METQTEEIQKAHYDKIAHQYSSNYGDKWSSVYRNWFINKNLLANLNIADKKVLDAMCGSGETTGFILGLDGIVTGLDISFEMLKLFKSRWPNTKVVCSSILNTGFPNAYFDCVTIVGGLHHLQPHIDEAVNEIARILKPQGYFCFMEPHTGSIADHFRNFWYKRDPLFEKNERALDFEKLETRHQESYEFISKTYVGSFAYLLVLNSLIFRMPFWLKSIYAPALICLEYTLRFLNFKMLTCVTICQWRKKDFVVGNSA